MESVLGTSAEEGGSGLVFLVDIHALWVERHLPQLLCLCWLIDFLKIIIFIFLDSFTYISCVEAALPAFLSVHPMWVMETRRGQIP